MRNEKWYLEKVRKNNHNDDVSIYFRAYLIDAFILEPPTSPLINKHFKKTLFNNKLITVLILYYFTYNSSIFRRFCCHTSSMITIKNGYQRQPIGILPAYNYTLK